MDGKEWMHWLSAKCKLQLAIIMSHQHYSLFFLQEGWFYLNMNISLNREKPCIEAAMHECYWTIWLGVLEPGRQLSNYECVTLCHFFPHPRTQSPSTLNAIPENVIYLSRFLRKLEQTNSYSCTIIYSANASDCWLYRSFIVSTMKEYIVSIQIYASHCFHNLKTIFISSSDYYTSVPVGCWNLSCTDTYLALSQLILFHQQNIN